MAQLHGPEQVKVRTLPSGVQSQHHVTHPETLNPLCGDGISPTNHATCLCAPKFGTYVLCGLPQYGSAGIQGLAHIPCSGPAKVYRTGKPSNQGPSQVLRQYLFGLQNMNPRLAGKLDNLDGPCVRGPCGPCRCNILGPASQEIYLREPMCGTWTCGTQQANSGMWRLATRPRGHTCMGSTRSRAWQPISMTQRRGDKKKWYKYCVETRQESV